MSDQHIADIGRRLAAVLLRWARDRDPELTKQLALLQTELCHQVKLEKEEAVPGEPTAPEKPHA